VSNGPEEPEVKVNKIGYYVPVSCCVMTDSTGVNYCEHPAPPPLSRRRRIRLNLQVWWATHRPHIHLGPCDVEDYE
jgi:hypothetical protein